MSLVEISGGRVNGNVFGGSVAQQSGRSENGNSADDKAKIVSEVSISSSANIANSVYGGSWTDNVSENKEAGSYIYGSTKVDMTSGGVANIYGVSLASSDVLTDVSVKAHISGNSIVNISGGKVTQSVYGGGNILAIENADVSNVLEGNANVSISGNATIIGSIYGGGSNGAQVLGTKTLDIGTADNAFVGSSLNIADFDTINVSNSATKASVYLSSFSGELNVNGGEITVNNTLNASKISILKDATLSLLINGDNTLSNSSLSMSNSGTLVLIANANLVQQADGYKLAANSEILNFGTVKSYGGTFDNNIFNVGEIKTVAASEITDTKMVEINAAQSVVINNDIAGSVSVAIASSATATKSLSISKAEVLNETTIEEKSVLSAWSFEVDGVDEENTVVLSFIIGEGYDFSDINVFHKGAGGVWENWTDLIGSKIYENGVYSFVATGFSDYALAIPEPATYVAILGAITFVFVLYRRRRQA